EVGSSGLHGHHGHCREMAQASLQVPQSKNPQQKVGRMGENVSMLSRERWIGLSLLVLSASLPAQADKKVREIVIHTHWGGLGTPQDRERYVKCRGYGLGGTGSPRATHRAI